LRRPGSPPKLIVDCGPDPEPTVRSEYYEMELREIAKRDYPHYVRNGPEPGE
jgi:hypothetical protein